MVYSCCGFKVQHVAPYEALFCIPWLQKVFFFKLLLLPSCLAIVFRYQKDIFTQKV